METLAIELEKKINKICVEYHYVKTIDIMGVAKELIGDIQQLASVLLQGNIFGIEEEEYTGFQQYVAQVLEDYMEAVRQDDEVLMVDTLDYGLRELLNIFIDTDTGEKQDE